MRSPAEEREKLCQVLIENRMDLYHESSYIHFNALDIMYSIVVHNAIDRWNICIQSTRHTECTGHEGHGRGTRLQLSTNVENLVGQCSC